VQASDSGDVTCWLSEEVPAGLPIVSDALMDPDCWRLIKDVFQNAIARRAEERQAFLADACSGDEPLREVVEQLVRAHGATGLLEQRPYANIGWILSLKMR
jgi:hypothetical protein